MKNNFKLKTIKWRLPFSYALIALITALSLGSVMLLVLRSYYNNLEKEYLENNAVSMQPIVESMLKSDFSQPQLDNQLTIISFLTETQLRILDQEENVVANSVPFKEKIQIVLAKEISGNTNLFLNYGTEDSQSTSSRLYIEKNIMGGEIVPSPGNDPEIVSVTISNAPMGGYWLSDDIQIVQSDISSQNFVQPLLEGTYFLELSNGPAYGSDILSSVSIAWELAAIFSCIIAIISGILISRQVTKPVLFLTNATQNMKKGILSTRVNLNAEKMHEFNQLANSFNTMAERIEKTVFTLRAFASDAAHEINTPLTAMKINLELSENESDPEKKQYYIKKAIQNSIRLDQLSANLLDLSRIESNSTPIEGKEFDLRESISVLSEPFASRADQKVINFTLELCQAPVPIIGNEQQISQAISNLLENALKFTPTAGSIQLQLNVHDGQAIINICDTGIGIPEDDFPFLFERFHRGRNTTSYPGNGLGLAIVKAIINAHQGEVKAISKQEGSCFNITLPINKT
ncbi:MAG: HAMP domain-containing histidine kinase [Anaerolineaceae bacterium]|nr:HAMP domain-containing histidine kinase [Anaerolineaceae bacterium]